MSMEIDLYNIDYHFASPIFSYKRPDFLSSVKKIFNEYVDRAKEKQTDKVYPGIMTELMSNDDRIVDFVRYINNIAWDVLDRQGYDMSNLNTYSDIWGQFHPYSSSMERHFHGAGTQLTGFYFLDTPPDSSTTFFHDPRSAKVYGNLPIKVNTPLTPAYNDIFYAPEPGDLIFCNAWLEHSFTRNRSMLPFNFIHINVNIIAKDNSLNYNANPVDNNTTVDNNNSKSTEISWKLPESGPVIV